MSEPKADGGAAVPCISLLDAVRALRVTMDASARNMPKGLDPLGDAARAFRVCAGMLQEIIEKHDTANDAHLAPKSPECAGSETRGPL